MQNKNNNFGGRNPEMGRDWVGLSVLNKEDITRQTNLFSLTDFLGGMSCYFVILLSSHLDTRGQIQELLVETNKNVISRDSFSPTSPPLLFRPYLTTIGGISRPIV